MKKNTNFSKAFCDKLLRIIVSRICATSQLMLGDLSRHYNQRTAKDIDKDSDQAYKNLSNLYQKLEWQRAYKQFVEIIRPTAS